MGTGGAHERVMEGPSVRQAGEGVRGRQVGREVGQEAILVCIYSFNISLGQQKLRS